MFENLKREVEIMKNATGEVYRGIRPWYNEWYRAVWLAMITISAWTILAILSPFREEYIGLYATFGAIAFIGSIILFFAGLGTSGPDY